MAESLSIHPVSRKAAAAFIAAHHYARTTPSTVCLYLGVYGGDRLVGVALWGYGVRPMHTIRKVFPALGTDDYLELNRFCLLDELPRNSETRVLALCVDYVRRHRPAVKVLLSWADGLRGKPGYIYQASNWLYGGFIRSDFYVSAEGEVVHPKLLITRYKTRTVWESLGLTHVWGLQFRYCKFLCSHGERKRLLASSPFEWTARYPKQGDLRFWIQEAGQASRETRELPKLQGVGRFHGPAPTSTMPLFDLTA